MLTTRRHDQQSSTTTTTTTSTSTTITGSSRRSSFRRWNHLTSSFTNRSHSMLFRYDNVGDSDGDEYYSSRGEEWGGANGQSATSTTTSVNDKKIDTKNSNKSILVARGQGTEMDHGPMQLDLQRRQQLEDERGMNDDDQRQSSSMVEDRTDVEDQIQGQDKDKNSSGRTAAERNRCNGCRVVASVQNDYDKVTFIPAVKVREGQHESTNNDCTHKKFCTSSPATIEATDGVKVDLSDQQQQQLQEDNFTSTSAEDENRTESNLSSSIVDSIDSIDCDSTVHTQLSNAELPLLQTNPKAIHCTCAPQPRRSSIYANKKLQEVFLPVSVQTASEPSTRSINRALNIFRNMKYKRIEPSNDDTSKRRSMRIGTSAVKPHRYHRGSFAEAASPSIHLRKEFPDSNVDREVDGLDELDRLVYGIDRTCFETAVDQNTPKSLADAYGLPVDEELSAIVEESEDVSTPSHSKSSRPAVPPLSSQNRAGKLAQYLKRDAEASSIYIGVMHMDASATSNGEHSNVDHSAHVMLLYGIDEESKFFPTPQMSRSTGKSPTCVPEIERGTIKESKDDKILQKDVFEKKDTQNCIEETPCRQKTKEFMDEIWLQGSCESSTGRISDITDMDFLKVYEPSHPESRNGEKALSENEEGNSLDDILRTPPKKILDSPLHCLLSEEDGSSNEDLDHVVPMSL